MDTVEIIASTVAAVVSLVALLFGAPSIARGARIAGRAIPGIVKATKAAEKAERATAKPGPEKRDRKPKG